MKQPQIIKKMNINYIDIMEEERPSSQVLRSSDEQKKNNFNDEINKFMITNITKNIPPTDIKINKYYSKKINLKIT